ncbi:MAG: hypothetical protein CMC79_04915 [Flavobacteriaceae bacterium]|nr:hypothetical protein [Flavobacteriaceae bacterium]|tara:strand:- start:653 stop:1534 length:882 start_codon:yes stop_codon:yes gene_type:complete
MNKKLFFIINPISKRKAKLLESEINNFFYLRKEEFIIQKSKDANDLKKIALEAINSKPNVIIACGGDGTINEVGQLIVGSKIKFGIIPIGSGNGVSNHLKIPYDFKKALEIIVSDSLKKMDVGKIEDRYFFSNVGFGIEVDFIKHYQSKNIHGLRGYFPAFFKSFRSYTAPNFVIELNNRKTTITPYVLILANINEQGYGISITPMAKSDDGILDLIMIKKTKPFVLLYYIIKILLGIMPKNEQNITRSKTKKVKLFSKNNDINVQIDGEFFLYNKSELEISINSETIDVLCP